MSDIKASERRLTAALDRIDYLLETASMAPAASPGSAPDIPDMQDLRAENARLSDALSIALTSPSPASRAPETAADDAGDDRLSSLADQAARLSMANEELAAANRGLIEAMAGQIDGVEAVAVALEAEIEALRAARAAEIAQIADIMAELQRMLAGTGVSDAPAAAGAASQEADVVSFGDEGGVPELTREAEPEQAFDAVYPEDEDDIADDDDDLGDAQRGGR